MKVRGIGQRRTSGVADVESECRQTHRGNAAEEIPDRTRSAPGILSTALSLWPRPLQILSTSISVFSLLKAGPHFHGGTQENALILQRSKMCPPLPQQQKPAGVHWSCFTTSELLAKPPAPTDRELLEPSVILGASL